MGNLAQPPEAVARLLPDVCPGGESDYANVAELKVAEDQGVAGGELDLALRS